MSKAHHINKHQALRFVFCTFCTLMVLEGCAAYHVYVRHGDIMTAFLVCVGWFKDSLHAIVEHLLEDL